MHFIFDLDGMISFEGKPISSNVRRALNQVTENGHDVIFTSSRSIREMLAVIHPDFHHYTMIGGNGSLIASDGKIVHSEGFSPKQVQKISHFLEAFDATYVIDGDWDYDYTGPSNHAMVKQMDPGNIAEVVPFDELPSIVKVVILSSTDHKQFAEALHDIDVFVHTCERENVLDIRPKGIHKRSALDNLGVEKDQYVVFSNDVNDVEMFEHATHSVMIGPESALSPFAKETIASVGDVEQQMIKKTMELSERYAI